MPPKLDLLYLESPKVFEIDEQNYRPSTRSIELTAQDNHAGGFRPSVGAAGGVGRSKSVKSSREPGKPSELDMWENRPNSSWACERQPWLEPGRNREWQLPRPTPKP